MYWDSVSKKNKRQSKLHGKLIPMVKLQRSAQTRKGFIVLLSIFNIYRYFFFLVENTNYGGSGIYSIFKGGYIIIQNAELDIESILAHFHNDMIKPVFIQKIIKTVKVCP